MNEDNVLIEVLLRKDLFQPFIYRTRQMIALKFKFIINDKDTISIVDNSINKAMINFITSGMLIKQIIRDLRCIKIKYNGKYAVNPKSLIQGKTHSLTIKFGTNVFESYANIIIKHYFNTFEAMPEGLTIKKLIKYEIEKFLAISLNMGIFQSITKSCNEGKCNLLNNYLVGEA